MTAFEWLTVFNLAAWSLNTGMIVHNWLMRRRYRRMLFALTDCVVMSWRAHHLPTYQAWADTLGCELEIEVSLRPRRAG